MIRDISMSGIYAFALLVLSLSAGALITLVPLKGDRPVVDVGKGRVIGVEEQAENFTYYAFRAIPYAQPPIGELRFKDPVSSEGWEGDLDGATSPRFCTQKGSSTSGEDCLYVNVYTPQDALITDIGEPLAVLVYIHGGGFSVGAMDEPDTCHPLLEKGVIVVTLQYRLGILGFLSTEDSSAPGNLGLKDQTLALRWVNDNIAAFGGDPYKITIFGESAGGHSVHYQLLTPAAEGLFRGAIMQSGTALCPRAHGRNFLKNAQVIASRFGCPESPSEDLVACLQEQPAQELIDFNTYFDEWYDHPQMFAPRVDGSFIPDEPLTLLKEGRYIHVPVIMGTNRDEGAMYALDWYAYPEIIESLQDDFERNGPISLGLLPEEEPLLTAYKVYDYYLPGLIIDKEQADNTTMLNGHRFYQIPLDWAVELMAPEVAVYMYELHHRGQYGHADKYLEEGLDLPQAAKWVSHADDLQYFFESSWGSLTTDEDLAVREIYARTWTNFAKTLDPTPDGSLGWKWLEVEVSDMKHLTILPVPLMEKDSRSVDREFWNSLPLRENPYKPNRS